MRILFYRFLSIALFVISLFFIQTGSVFADPQTGPKLENMAEAYSFRCDNRLHTHVREEKVLHPPRGITLYYVLCRDLTDVNAEESPLGSIDQPEALRAFGTGEEGIGAFVRNGLGLLVIVAAILAFVFLVIGGIGLITAGGDKTKVEGSRSKIVYAIVGLVVVFLAFAIIQFVQTFFGVNIFGKFDIPFI